VHEGAEVSHVVFLVERFLPAMDGAESGEYINGVSAVDLRELSLLDRDVLSEDALLLLHVTGCLLERVVHLSP
jgi:hypothetical protein